MGKSRDSTDKKSSKKSRPEIDDEEVPVKQEKDKKRKRTEEEEYAILWTVAPHSVDVPEQF